MSDQGKNKKKKEWTLGKRKGEEKKGEKGRSHPREIIAEYGQDLPS